MRCSSNAARDRVGGGGEEDDKYQDAGGADSEPDRMLLERALSLFVLIAVRL